MNAIEWWGFRSPFSLPLSLARLVEAKETTRSKAKGLIFDGKKTIGWRQGDSRSKPKTLSDYLKPKSNEAKKSFVWSNGAKTNLIQSQKLSKPKRFSSLRSQKDFLGIEAKEVDICPAPGQKKRYSGPKCLDSTHSCIDCTILFSFKIRTKGTKYSTIRSREWKHCEQKPPTTTAAAVTTTQNDSQQTRWKNKRNNDTPLLFTSFMFHSFVQQRELGFYFIFFFRFVSDFILVVAFIFLSVRDVFSTHLVLLFFYVCCFFRCVSLLHLWCSPQAPGPGAREEEFNSTVQSTAMPSYEHTQCITSRKLLFRTLDEYMRFVHSFFFSL